MPKLAAGLLGLVLATSANSTMAQPLANPYQAPVPVPVPAPVPAPVAEPVATALLERAEQLLGQGQFADAKQLAVESLQLNPSAALADRAGWVLAAADAGLGINGAPHGVANDMTAAPPRSPTAESPSAVNDRPTPSLVDGPGIEAAVGQRQHLGAVVHGSMLGATLGAGLTLQLRNEATAVVGGVAGAVLGGYLGNRYRSRLSPGDTRTVGSGSMWAGAVGGLVVDVVTYPKGASRRQIALGISLGSLVGGVAGYGLARNLHYTTGQVALIDSLALLGGGAGLSLGFLMQPPTAQAYSANTALGIGAGFVVGALLAKPWSPSEARMLRITGAATVGGLLPWLGYAASSGGTSAQQWAGGLSVLGSISGAWLGYYLTHHHAPSEQFDLLAASPALLQRSGNGHWRLGVSAPRAVGRDISTDAITVFDVAAGRF